MPMCMPCGRQRIKLCSEAFGNGIKFDQMGGTLPALVTVVGNRHRWAWRIMQKHTAQLIRVHPTPTLTRRRSAVLNGIRFT